MHYLDLLQRLHDEVQPAGYLEIGVDWGDSLQLSRARSVAIDPAPKPLPESFLGKPGLILYAGTSDDFFREQQREAMLGEAPLDFAFIDGLHEFAQVVRDLEHVERWSHPGTVVAIHDVLPRDAAEAAPAFHDGFWTGDVWRVVPFLRQHRPDLQLWLTAVEPTGMLIVTRLNPEAAGMADLAAAENATFPGPGPEYDRLVNEFIAATVAEPAERVIQTLSLDRRVEGAWGFETHWGMRMVAEASWRPVLETAAESPGTPHHERGMRACLRLIGAHWLPPEVREQAWNLLPQYANALTTIWPGATWSPLALPGASAGLMTSPAPVIVSGGLVATVATPANAPERRWRLLRLDDTLAAQSAEVLIDETRPEKDCPPGASFVEQLQPFEQDGRLQAIVSVSDRNPRGVAQAGLVAIADGTLRDLRLLSDADNGRHERNWVPFVTDTGLCVVSCWEPTETLGIEGSSSDGVDAETAARVALRPAPRLAERWHGASAGVAVTGGWLFLVNERATVPENGAPLTFARFVFLDADFRVTGVSPHFWVSARGQDLASGLTRQGETLVAGFTSHGQGTAAILARMPLTPVLAALLPLKSAGARIAESATAASGAGSRG